MGWNKRDDRKKIWNSFKTIPSTWQEIKIWLKLVPYTLLSHKVEIFYKKALRHQREDIFAQWRKQLDKKGWGKPKGHSCTMDSNQVTALTLLLLAILRGTDGATGKFLSQLTLIKRKSNFPHI
jgi:hypothetical protein